MSMKTRHQGRISILTRQLVAILLISLMAMPALVTHRALAQGDGNESFRVRLKSREFVPATGAESAVGRQLQSASSRGQIHALIQFWQIPSDAERAALENAGVKLLAYVPTNTWFASMPAGLGLQSNALSGVRWIGAVQPEDRIAPTLQAGMIGPHATHDDGTVSLDVRFFADVTNAEVAQLIAKYDGVIETKAPAFHRFAVRLDPQAISSLASEDSVQWIAKAAPPKTTANDGVRTRTNVDAVQAAPYNLSGSGVDLGIWDGGKIDNHVDFNGRLIVVDASASVNDHATHVAGTMAGDGSNSASQGGSPLQWRGMAPGADIISYYWDNHLTDHDGAINTYGIELSQNSWGYVVDQGWLCNCYLYGDYDYGAPDYDDIVTGLYGKRISVIFAAGNERDDGDCGMSSIPPYINYANVGPPATAKNIIAVGATNSNGDSMTSFSSWGPMDDGRIKPDVVAPGCESTGEGYIHSTLPGDVYGAPGWCGTSMAAPTVSGIAGLLIEQYRKTFGIDPLPSTLKALLVQTAVDLNDGTSYYNPGPDYASGYGRVDAQAAADLIIAREVREDQVSDGQTDTFTLDVPSGTPVIQATLAWDDEPGAVNANPALVNNLDLTLIEPDGTTAHLPWVLDPANPSNNATTGTDSINNVEQVQVNNPVAGTWQIQVTGTSVPVGPQDYSLAAQTLMESGSAGPVVYDSHTVDDDDSGNSNGNGDGIVHCGETIELYVALRNQGSDTATQVNAAISTSDPYVTWLYNTDSSYPDTPGSGTGTNVNAFDFAVDSSTPNDHVIYFDLGISASNGGPWSDSFDVLVTCDRGCNDPHEPSDMWGQATPIAYDTTLTDHDICPEGDVDYYAFTGSTGDTIVADIDAWTIGSTLDSYLYLYDTDGVTELTSNDDYHGWDSRIVYTLPADGTYYLKVRDYWGGGGPDYFYTISLGTTASPFDVAANWTSSAPAIDGQILAGEWDDAGVYEITVPGPGSMVVQGQGGLAVMTLPEVLLQGKRQGQTLLMPKAQQSAVTLYAMNDGEHLYLAMDNPNDTSVHDYDQMGVYFDDNPLPLDGQWTNMSCGNPDGEGNFWVLTDTVKYREWIAGPATCKVVIPAPGTLGAVGYNSGHTQAEVAIDLSSSALRAMGGDVINMYLWIFDYGTCSFDGQWPLGAVYDDPATYGRLTLEAQTLEEGENIIYLPSISRNYP